MVMRVYSSVPQRALAHDAMDTVAYGVWGVGILGLVLGFTKNKAFFVAPAIVGALALLELKRR